MREYHRDVLVERVLAYRAVEHALAIHGNVEAALYPLDGHHSQTHGNKIEKSCEEGEEQTVKQAKKKKKKMASRHMSTWQENIPVRQKKKTLIQ